MKLFGKELKFNGKDVYHEGNLPKFPETSKSFYSATEPEGGKLGDIWYKTELSLPDAPSKTFSYKNTAQEYVVPITGPYIISCHGARGGYRGSSTSYAGKGGKVTGTVNLTKGEILYIYTGQNGNVSLSEGQYTFNGGGSGRASNQSGGGATDVRLVGGNWDDPNSLLSRIIVAGGGGSCGGTNKKGGDANTSSSGGYGTGGQAGTETSGGAGSSSYPTTKGQFGKGGAGINVNSGYGGAGGGGWYGGAGNVPDSSGDDDKGGGGGSNYILTSSSSKPSGYTPTSKHYFTNTSTSNTNSEVDGKVVIYEPTETIVETYVYYKNTWTPISSAIDSEALMNEDTFSTLKTTDKTIVGSINEVFQNVSSGKSSIAQAITSMGVSASENDSFSSLSSKIKKIHIKKYDTGEVLTKGVHYKPAVIGKEEDFYERYNLSLYGEIKLASSKLVYAKSGGNHYILKYDPETDSYEEKSNKYDFSEEVTEVSGNYYRYAWSYYDYDGLQVNTPYTNLDTSEFNEYNTACERLLTSEDSGKSYYVIITTGTTSPKMVDGIPYPPERKIFVELFEINGTHYNNMFTAEFFWNSPDDLPYEIEELAISDKYLVFRDENKFYKVDLNTKAFEVLCDAPPTNSNSIYQGFLMKDKYLIYYEDGINIMDIPGDTTRVLSSVKKHTYSDFLLVGNKLYVYNTSKIYEVDIPGAKVSAEYPHNYSITGGQIVAVPNNNPTFISSLSTTNCVTLGADENKIILL